MLNLIYIFTAFVCICQNMVFFISLNPQIIIQVSFTMVKNCHLSGIRMAALQLIYGQTRLT
ncbi:MAG: hypothetical protein WBO36_02350 [Saprospiraceae bacterium]